VKEGSDIEHNIMKGWKIPYAMEQAGVCLRREADTFGYEGFNFREVRSECTSYNPTMMERRGEHIAYNDST